jgi:hypothetical protein
MLLFRPLRVSTLLMLTCGVAIACPASHSQQPQKPDAPIATQAHVEQSVNVVSANAPYRAISGNQRIQWAAQQTFGPQSWLTGTFTAAIGTARDSPAEYGPHWEGFAKRYGMRFSGVASSNTIEAGLGALWGEDPRYVRDPSLPIRHRLTNVLLLSFTAHNRHGRLVPAYARYIAIPGNNFLSNTWRVNSEATTSAALTRTGYGVLSEIASNAWTEFWPDVKHRMFKK